jgi:hypothetical protein
VSDTTIKVDSAVRDRLAVLAAQRGSTIRDLVAELAEATPTREELAARQAKAAAYIAEHLLPALAWWTTGGCAVLGVDDDLNRDLREVPSAGSVGKRARARLSAARSKSSMRAQRANAATGEPCPHWSGPRQLLRQVPPRPGTRPDPITAT